jgi:hypothetical protein
MVPNDETTIVIPVVLGESLVTGAYDTYRVRICWCKKIKKQTLKYGMGVQFLAKIEGLMKDADLADHYSQCDLCDLCDQRLEGEGVYYFNDMVYLCLPCYEHLKRYPTGILRESIISFIYRNSV